MVENTSTQTWNKSYYRLNFEIPASAKINARNTQSFVYPSYS